MLLKRHERFPGSADPGNRKAQSFNLMSDQYSMVDVVAKQHDRLGQSVVTYERFRDVRSVGARVRMLESLDPAMKLFRDTSTPTSTFIDKDLGERLMKLKPKLRGLDLTSI